MAEELFSSYEGKLVKNALWQTVLGEIELSVSRASFVTWFKNTELIREESGDVVIGVPNVFAKQQFEVKFNQQIETSLKRNGIDVSRISYVISAGKKPPARTTGAMAESQPLSPTSLADVRPVRSGNQPTLNPKYTFETF